MNEDNVVEVKNQGKNPVEQAINKLREEKIKDIQNKVNAQTKVAFDANIVANKEMDKLKTVIEELEFEKARITEFAKATK